MAFRLLRSPITMQQEFEQLLKDQLGRVTGKMQDLAREALKDDIARLQHELSELRARVARLEAERVEAAAEQV